MVTIFTKYGLLLKTVRIEALNYNLRLNSMRLVSSSGDGKGSSDLPKNVLETLHTAQLQSEKGVIYDKKPFKIRLSPEKKYHWCACGQSKNQPFCDGTHKSPYLQIKLKPVRFQVGDEKEYWLCNCKQTSKRPFCDGTHKREDIQAKIR